MGPRDDDVLAREREGGVAGRRPVSEGLSLARVVADEYSSSGASQRRWRCTCCAAPCRSTRSCRPAPARHG
jgi:hypothetical protein